MNCNITGQCNKKSKQTFTARSGFFEDQKGIDLYQSIQKKHYKNLEYLATPGILNPQYYPWPYAPEKVEKDEQIDNDEYYIKKTQNVEPAASIIKKKLGDIFTSYFATNVSDYNSDEYTVSNTRISVNELKKIEIKSIINPPPSNFEKLQKNAENVGIFKSLIWGAFQFASKIFSFFRLSNMYKGFLMTNEEADSLLKKFTTKQLKTTIKWKNEDIHIIGETQINNTPPENNWLLNNINVSNSITSGYFNVFDLYAIVPLNYNNLLVLRDMYISVIGALITNQYIFPGENTTFDTVLKIKSIIKKHIYPQNQSFYHDLLVLSFIFHIRFYFFTFNGNIFKFEAKSNVINNTARIEMLVFDCGKGSLVVFAGDQIDNWRETTLPILQSDILYTIYKIEKNLTEAKQPTFNIYSYINPVPNWSDKLLYFNFDVNSTYSSIVASVMKYYQIIDFESKVQESLLNVTESDINIKLTMLSNDYSLAIVLLYANDQNKIKIWGSANETLLPLYLKGDTYTFVSLPENVYLTEKTKSLFLKSTVSIVKEEIKQFLNKLNALKWKKAEFGKIFNVETMYKSKFDNFVIEKLGNYPKFTLFAKMSEREAYLLKGQIFILILSNYFSFTNIMIAISNFKFFFNVVSDAITIQKYLHALANLFNTCIFVFEKNEDYVSVNLDYCVVVNNPVAISLMFDYDNQSCYIVRPKMPLSKNEIDSYNKNREFVLQKAIPLLSNIIINNFAQMKTETQIENTSVKMIYERPLNLFYEKFPVFQKQIFKVSPLDDKMLEEFNYPPYNAFMFMLDKSTNADDNEKKVYLECINNYLNILYKSSFGNEELCAKIKMPDYYLSVEDLIFAFSTTNIAVLEIFKQSNNGNILNVVPKAVYYDDLTKVEHVLLVHINEDVIRFFTPLANEVEISKLTHHFEGAQKKPLNTLDMLKPLTQEIQNAQYATALIEA